MPLGGVLWGAPAECPGDALEPVCPSPTAQAWLAGASRQALATLGLPWGCGAWKASTGQHVFDISWSRPWTWPAPRNPSPRSCLET